MANHSIEFRGVTKSYDAFHAVKNLELTVEEGEFFALLGPSGCGKSTILKMIAGIEDPTAGEIYVNGRLVNYELPRNRDVAMVFQNYALYPHMDVAKNIAYPLTTSAVRGLSRQEIQDRMRKAADIVHIADQLTKYPAALSGGQRQRVALARAIIRDPAVFLMDEPLSNLDALLRESMRYQLIELHRAVGKAMVYVTHDQLEAMTMSNRMVVLNAGEVQQIGTPEDIFQVPANLFVAGFVGQVRMNLIGARSLGGGRVKVGETELATETDTGPAKTPLTVGIRPTDVMIGGSENAMTGQVDIVEFTGADAILTLAFGETRLNVRQVGRKHAREGETVTVSIEPSLVHVFDANGQRMK